MPKNIEKKIFYYCYIFENETEEDEHWVEFPDIQQASTNGMDEKHTLQMAKERLNLVIKSYLTHNTPIPPAVDRSAEGYYAIQVDQDLANRINGYKPQELEENNKKIIKEVEELKNE